MKRHIKPGLFVFLLLYSPIFYIWLDYMITRGHFYNIYIIFLLTIFSTYGFLYHDITIRTNFSDKYVKYILIVFSTILILNRVNYKGYIIASLSILHMLVLRNVYNIVLNKGALFRYKKRDELKLEQINSFLSSGPDFTSNLGYCYHLTGFNDDLDYLAQLLWAWSENNNLYLFCDGVIRIARGGIFEDLIIMWDEKGLKNWSVKHDIHNHLSKIILEVADKDDLRYLLEYLWTGLGHCWFVVSELEFKSVTDLVSRKYYIKDDPQKIILVSDERLYTASIRSSDEILNKLMYTFRN